MFIDFSRVCTSLCSPTHPHHKHQTSSSLKFYNTPTSGSTRSNITSPILHPTALPLWLLPTMLSGTNKHLCSEQRPVNNGSSAALFLLAAGVSPRGSAAREKHCAAAHVHDVVCLTSLQERGRKAEKGRERERDWESQKERRRGETESERGREKEGERGLRESERELLCKLQSALWTCL